MVSRDEWALNIPERDCGGRCARRLQVPHLPQTKTGEAVEESSRIQAGMRSKSRNCASSSAPKRKKVRIPSNHSSSHQITSSTTTAKSLDCSHRLLLYDMFSLPCVVRILRRFLAPLFIKSWGDIYSWGWVEYS